MQGELEAALSKLFVTEVTTAAAGRTDAGVHALGQVVSTAAPADADPERVKNALNALCGPSISVWSCRRVSEDFNARFSARSRTYLYALLEGEVHDPFLAGTSLHHPDLLDVDAMNEGAGHLLGNHDFTSFGRVDPERGSPERTLYELRCARRGRLVRIRARANAFIHQMVRSIVGTLVRVGEGRRGPEEMGQVLAARSRAAAGPVAPAHGLCLVAVEYDDGWSRPLDPYG